VFDLLIFLFITFLLLNALNYYYKSSCKFVNILEEISYNIYIFYFKICNVAKVLFGYLKLNNSKGYYIILN